MRIAKPLLLLLLSAGSVFGMELGETRDSIVAQHGRATEENHSRNTAVYRSGPWKVDIEFRGDIAWQLTFTRLGQLSEEEIQSILDQNAGGKQWRELESPGAKRSWERSDLATAECDREKPRSIIFRESPPLPEQSANNEPSLLAKEEPSPTETKTAETPAVYAIEQPHVTVPAPKPSSIGWGTRLGIFIDQRPLVLVIPAVILLFAWLFNSFVVKKPAPAVAPTRRVITPRAANDAMATETAPASIDSLSEEAFELLVGEIFRRKGYSVEISGGVGSDGGSDLTLRREEEFVVVQCRHWNSYKVSEPSLHELYGAVMAAGATSGIFVTTGQFTDDAIVFADDRPLRLIDRAELERLIKEVSRFGENLCRLSGWVDEFASTVAVVNPVCPFCGGGMKLKRGVQGRPFWTCQSFPACSGKRNGRVELLRTRIVTAE